MFALRLVLLLDSAVLLGLGSGLMLVPERTAVVFHFEALPAAYGVLLGVWGCALLSLGVGCFIAATEPYRHLVIVQIGIVRGLLEVLVCLAAMARGTVTFQQVWLGIVSGAVIAVVYSVVYPRRLAPPAA